jgi:hypothetical protein
LHGDATGIDELSLAKQQELYEAGKTLGEPLRFGRETTLQVLGDWESGLLSDEQRASITRRMRKSMRWSSGSRISAIRMS